VADAVSIATPEERIRRPPRASSAALPPDDRAASKNSRQCAADDAYNQETLVSAAGFGMTRFRSPQCIAHDAEQLISLLRLVHAHMRNCLVKKNGSRCDDDYRCNLFD
jgi:hypothetical protein